MADNIQPESAKPENDNKKDEGRPAARNQETKRPSRLGTLFLAAALAGGAYYYAQTNIDDGPPPEEFAYSEFLARTESGKVSTVVIQGNEITGTLSDGKKFKTYGMEDPALVQTLKDNKVKFEAKPVEGPGLLVSLLFNLLPMAMFIAFFVYVMPRMMGGGKNGPMGLGASRAKPMEPDREKVTFDDVAGIDEAKTELKEIVDFLKSPEKFEKLGGKIPKGALLVGPPGTGKTLTARAVAGEASVPFFSVSGSEFVELFAGMGAARVRNMFAEARKQAPCILFIDEIDAVGRHRGAGLGAGNDEREQTLNQILVEMDGFDSKQGIIVIAATNRPDVLDPALLRPGRFDRQVVVGLPDVKGREQILAVHVKKIKLDPRTDLSVIARATPGFSGADLANLVNEAALMAVRSDRDLVTMKDFSAAADKILMGSERKSMVMSQKDKELTAYHEAGHALVGIHVKGNDPLHKVSIIPRGRALGVTMNLPDQDRYNYTKAEMEARMAMMFGGRVAEELVFGSDNVTTGASNDIQQATEMARRMVTEFGMSEKLGRVRYRENQEEVFLGHSVARSQNMSEETAKLVDGEIRRLTEEAEKKAKDTLTRYKDQLHTLARALLKYETLTGDEVRRVLSGDDLDQKPPGNDNRPPPGNLSGGTALPGAAGSPQGPKPG